MLDGVFDGWRGSISQVMLSLMQKLVCPLGISIAVVFLVFNIIKAIGMKNQGMESGYDKVVIRCVICLIAIVLLSSFMAWGGAFFA